MANALSWTWYLLSQNPECERRFHDEIDRELQGRLPTYDDVPRLRYAEMVLAESMRLYPPAWAMGRYARADFRLGEFLLPANTTVLMSQFITHRDARFFPDPLRFDPGALHSRSQGATNEADLLSLLAPACGNASANRLHGWKVFYCWLRSRRSGSSDSFPVTASSPSP